MDHAGADETGSLFGDVGGDGQRSLFGPRGRAADGAELRARSGDGPQAPPRPDRHGAGRDSHAWSERDARMWQTVVPQMAGWLPADEADQMRRSFAQEFDRLPGGLTAAPACEPCQRPTSLIRSRDTSCSTSGIRFEPGQHHAALFVRSYTAVAVQFGEPSHTILQHAPGVTSWTALSSKATRQVPPGLRTDG